MNGSLSEGVRQAGPSHRVLGIIRMTMKHAVRTCCFASLMLASFLAPAGMGASKSPVRGGQAMVVSTEPRATEAGIQILKGGGNAVDAAVAVGFVLAVTHPSAGNLGGGGFMLIRSEKTGEALVIDYREMAPRGAGRTMYQDKDGHVLEDASTIGYRAIGVPGTVAGLTFALEKYGTMKLAQVLAPAITLARTGVELGYFESESMKSARKLLEKFPESRRIYLRDGNYYQEGEKFQQPELARSLEGIAGTGAREFYEGTIAQLIA